MATTNIYDMSDTWNAGGTVFDAIKMNVTNSASAAGSDLLDLAIGGSSRFRVDKRSTVTVAGQSLTSNEALSVLDMATTWNTSGAPTAIKLDVTNTASDGASVLMDLQIGGSSRFKVDKRSTVTVAGQSLTGSEALSVLDMAATWNTTGTPTAIKLDVTDTASDATSLLLDLQVGGSSQVSVRKNGLLRFNTSGGDQNKSIAWTTTTGQTIGTGVWMYAQSGGEFRIYGNGNIMLHIASGLGIRNTDHIGWHYNPSAYNSQSDVRLYRDAAQTLALRNSTNAQTFNVYNTYTDASNYERGFLKWNSNVFEIGTEAGGTGTNRGMRIYMHANATYPQLYNSTTNFVVQSNSQSAVVMSDTGVLIQSDGQYRFSTSATAALTTNDTGLKRDSAAVVAVTDGSTGTGSLKAKGYIAPDDGELTIATGAVTATGTYHTVDTEADAATDDLDTISGGVDGQILVIQPENDARTIVVKNGAAMLLAGAADFTMDSANDALTLMYSSALTGWVELSRSANSA